ncbi:cation-translocating P-type ATPase [Natronoarchaeum sp. GCM10025703]|uniref:cation-translocating P-type ATPase n=1 Tax=Natronoarchaeum sp. GCM10025703 TaxID=3252685 RepID=UPI00360A0EF9
MTRSNADTTPSEPWHATAMGDIFSALATDEEGLSTDEADRRLSEYGTNDIHEAERTSTLDLLLSQFRNPLIYLLVVAALLSLGTGFLPGGEPSYTEAVFIVLIITANAVFGFVQDYQAARSIEALRELATPQATVFRDGKKQLIDAEQVVPGDIIYLEQGDAIPADARVLNAEELRTNESLLTGESKPVEKTTECVDDDTPLAERRNMVYKNTTVVKGRGRAVVVETGMETEVGGIATQLEEADDRQTPFQTEVEHLGKQIGGLVVSLIVLVVVVQFLFTATESTAILLVGITLAVAGVPEGLPAVVTFTLALGAREMVDRNALVRRLPVVESLGSVDVIVTDKTGTVTENRMTVTRLYASGSVVNLSKSNSKSGNGDVDGRRVVANGDQSRDPDVGQLLRCGSLCNNVDRTDDDEYRGEPTEIALRKVADDEGIDPSGERIREIQFSSERKRMTVIVEDGEPTAYMKGAPEVVLERCDSYLEDGDVHELTNKQRREILNQTESFAEDALRVLGFASEAR